MRIGSINLTWWRKRPRVRVAERYNYTQIIDMDKAISWLDADTSAFTTLLNRMGSTSVYPEFHGLTTVGDFVRDPKSGRSGKIIARPLKDPDDWFSTERQIIVKWDSAPPPTVIDWLDDETLPRPSRLPF